MFPVVAKFGPITVYSFGVMMALGFYFGTSFAVREFERRGGDGEQMWNLLLWTFFGGVVSSRVLSIFNDLPGFIADPTVALSGAGFVWYGGFIGGAAIGMGLARWYGFAVGVVAECATLGLSLGQALGRVGCHVAGDGDWGKVTELPWGVAYEKAIVGWPHPEGVLVHPTPLYETAAYLAVFAVLMTVRKRNPPVGTMMGIYLVGSSLARFSVEFIRVNPILAMGLTQAQFIAIGLFLIGVVLLVRVGSAPAGSAPVAA